MTDNRAFRAATFLVTAARDVIDEPEIYAPFRMLDAVERLLAEDFDDEFLKAMQPDLQATKYAVMTDRDAFIASLDKLTEAFAREAKRRNLEAEPAPGPAA